MLLPAISSLSESAAYALFQPRNIGNVGGLAAILDHDDDPRKKLGEWSSLIGIVTAIVGNVLIALALNVQRYAHIQLHKRRAQVRERARQALRDAAKTQSNGKHNGVGNGGGYGTVEADSNGAETTGTDGALHTGRSGQARGSEAGESDPLTHWRFRNGSAGDRTGGAENGEDDDDDGEIKVASTYLKSSSWWLGQILITIGEMGNFLAYGFAPASIVSPLGVVALISNCVIAPFFFKEVFRQRDFWGVLVSITGAVTVVLSAKQEETKLAPHDIWDAITTMEFEIYVAVSCSLIVFLMWASPRYGNRTILIDLGLVGLFGGYTVLATKGVSSMLSSTLLRAFTTPVTYALLVVLLGTAVMQVRYVNKALQRFDSTQVIPIQFVLFTLSVILGSAVLYRDFERTSGEQAAKFIGGCMLTFFGVFLITSGRPNADDDEDGLSDEEGIEETIGLAEQSPGPTAPVAGGPQTPLPSSRRGSDAARSRRSSRASRVSFLDAVNKPLAVLSETGVPSPRVPNRASFGIDGAEGSPLSDNPWRDAAISSPSPHPGMTPQALSAESVPTISSMTHTHPLGVSPGSVGGPSSASAQLPLDATPVTPRPARDPALSSSRPSSHHFPPGPLYSPSPLSSTVSAVVADTLLRHVGGGVGSSNGDSPSPRTLLRARRSRPGLRNSLFVPQDELVLLYDAEEGAGPAAAMDAEAFSGGARSQGPGSPSEREGLLRVGSGGGGGGDPQRHTFRTRARSVSHAIGDLFGRKKRRRGPSVGGGDEGEEEEQNGSGPATGAIAGGARTGLPGSQAQVAKVSAPSAETL